MAEGDERNTIQFGFLRFFKVVFEFLRSVFVRKKVRYYLKKIAKITFFFRSSEFFSLLIKELKEQVQRLLQFYGRLTAYHFIEFPLADSRKVCLLIIFMTKSCHQFDGGHSFSITVQF